MSRSQSSDRHPPGARQIGSLCDAIMYNKAVAASIAILRELSASDSLVGKGELVEKHNRVSMNYQLQLCRDVVSDICELRPVLPAGDAAIATQRIHPATSLQHKPRESRKSRHENRSTHVHVDKTTPPRSVRVRVAVQLLAQNDVGLSILQMASVRRCWIDPHRNAAMH